MRRTRVFGVVSAAVAVLAMSAGPALADPPTETYPALAGTGSDTTQYVLNGLAGVIPAIGSYDAVDPSTGLPGGTIQTREDGAVYARPNGSGNGLRALTASINSTGTYQWQGTTITGQLDFARSSSGPSVAGTALTFIPFAKDAVSYAYSNFANASVPSYLTEDELADIYTGDTTTYVDVDGVTRNYIPLLPQAGSGTRAFFLQSLGLVEDDVKWITTPTVQENDGSEIDAIGKLVPFSVASWLAQTNNVVPNTLVENIILLGSLDDDIQGVVPPVTNAGKLNPLFPFNRNVYNVVETARLTSVAPADVLLQQTFAGTTSSVCQATATITTYGFATIGANCGDTSTYKSGYVVPA
jgi:ABC-type phosphate transport system substrate-binding protein